MHLLCLLQHVIQPGKITLQLRYSNITLLDHSHQSLVPWTHIHQQDRHQRLHNEFHVWPNAICHVQYNFYIASANIAHIFMSYVVLISGM